MWFRSKFYRWSPHEKRGNLSPFIYMHLSPSSFQLLQVTLTSISNLLSSTYFPLNFPFLAFCFIFCTKTYINRLQFFFSFLRIVIGEVNLATWLLKFPFLNDFLFFSLLIKVPFCSRISICFSLCGSDIPILEFVVCLGLKIWTFWERIFSRVCQRYFMILGVLCHSIPSIFGLV